jgi:hypothetical protein
MKRIITAVIFVSLAACALPVAAAGQGVLLRPSTPAVPTSVSSALSRPAALPALYLSLAALQGYDVYSTQQAMKRGATEANPMMQGVVGNNGAFIAVKAALVVGTVVAAERLWKTNKAAAIGVMLASNGVAALVAARNMRTLRQLR